MQIEDTQLITAARAAQANAYAPYSNYPVGAAVRTADGRICPGGNVENVSYGLTQCAERTAICTAVAAGAREIVAVAVVTKNGATPCGACRQVLAEFAPKDSNLPLRVFLVTENGERTEETTIAALLPGQFTL